MEEYTASFFLMGQASAREQIDFWSFSESSPDLLKVLDHVYF